MSVPYLYPTAATVNVFLEGLHVEHAFRVDWKEDDPRVPIYGYNDRYFSKVAESRSIIQGFLVLNFVYGGYLHDVLRGLARPGDAKSTRGNFGFGPAGRTQRKQEQKNLAEKLRQELKEFGGDANSKTAKLNYIQDLFKSKNASREEKKDLKEALRQAVRPPQPTPKSIRKFSSPLASQAEDIKMELYYQDPDEAGWRMVFNNVYFSSVSQQVSAAGAEGSSEPLYEVYEFIARDRQIVHDDFVSQTI